MVHSLAILTPGFLIVIVFVEVSCANCRCLFSPPSGKKNDKKELNTRQLNDKLYLPKVTLAPNRQGILLIFRSPYHVLRLLKLFKRDLLRDDHTNYLIK